MITFWYGVYVLNDINQGKYPIAVFQYIDMAHECATKNYRGRSEVRPFDMSQTMLVSETTGKYYEIVL